MAYYPDHSRQLRTDLAREVPAEALRELHRRRPLLHAAIAVANVAALLGSAFAIASLGRWYLWLPFAFIAGFAVFDFTVLLHEVVHRTVVDSHRNRFYRFLGFLYAIPSGISPTQFTKWHLDHHAGLGSDTEDPKRHYLSPKVNARWLKLLYFTPALFPIYFRAAAREAASYPPEIRSRIARERLASVGFHLAVLSTIGITGGWFFAWKVYVVPVFFVFPIAFALNRLGQHYDIDAADPAQWSTLVKGSHFWSAVFLFSNYHLEHHYFPSVPFYNLPRLQKLLLPFFERRGMKPVGYGELLWGYLVLNRRPHSKWEEGAAAAAAPSISR